MEEVKSEGLDEEVDHDIDEGLEKIGEFLNDAEEEINQRN